MQSLPIFLSSTHTCGYLDDHVAQSIFIDPSVPLSSLIYSELIKKGFRRSGDDVYRPYCLNCNQCIPVRLMVNQFHPNRSQKRCWQKNINTVATVKPAVFEQDHFQMYLRYQLARHNGGDMADASKNDYIRFLGSSWCDIKFIQFTVNDELAAVTVVDEIENSLSAVYTFFEPKFAAYSLGTYAVLWLIQQAITDHRDYLYLGFWIKSSRKMAYKSNYQPLQLFNGNQWVDFSF